MRPKLRPGAERTHSLAPRLSEAITGGACYLAIICGWEWIPAALAAMFVVGVVFGDRFSLMLIITNLLCRAILPAERRFEQVDSFAVKIAGTAAAVTLSWAVFEIRYNDIEWGWTLVFVVAAVCTVSSATTWRPGSLVARWLGRAHTSGWKRRAFVTNTRRLPPPPGTATSWSDLPWATEMGMVGGTTAHTTYTNV